MREDKNKKHPLSYLTQQKQKLCEKWKYLDFHDHTFKAWRKSNNMNEYNAAFTFCPKAQFDFWMFYYKGPKIKFNWLSLAKK